MNDFLRGFCNSCEYPIIMDKKGEPSHYDAFAEKHGMSLMMAHVIVPSWFLSAKQMDIITASKEFSEFVETNEVYCWINPHDALAEFLKRNPFLVAKILKQIDEKGENK